MINNNLGYLFLAGVGLYIFNQLRGNAEASARSEEIDLKPVPVPPNQAEAPKATITTAEATAIAQKQLIAMDQYGTDESLLFGSLRGLNGADLRLVYKAFGIVNYSDRLGTRERIPIFGQKLDLFGWYVQELDKTELGSMRILWYKAGVTF